MTMAADNSRKGKGIAATLVAGEQKLAPKQKEISYDNSLSTMRGKNIFSNSGAKVLVQDSLFTGNCTPT